MTQGTEPGGKNDKRTNNPIPRVIYAESNAVRYCYIELILWHKYKTREKRRMKHSSIDQAPLY